MRKVSIPLLLLILLFSCKSKVEKIKLQQSDITESIYASGIIKSRNQYTVFPTVSGIIESILVEEGDSVKIGTPLLSISNQAQQWSKENAALAAQFADVKSNTDKLNQAKLQTELARNKYLSDSLMLKRQQDLWQKQIGTKFELEQRELAAQNSKTQYLAAFVNYMDLKRQVDLNAAQSKNNLKISNKLEEDFTLKSEAKGIVYTINKEKGELVSPQTPVAVIGAADSFILEMQVDENDILKVTLGQKVLISLDSYQGQVFEARVTKLNPYMNERSKTFLVEAEFIQAPQKLYPNVNFEASIVIAEKAKALLLPRTYMLNDSTVMRSDGEKVSVKTGLKDYRNIEIISGLNVNDELIKPKE